MTSALGPDLLVLLLPGLAADHPVSKRAVKALPDLAGLERPAVVAALLDGPYARAAWDGSLPKQLVDAVAAEAHDASQGHHRGWVNETVQRHLLDVLGRDTVAAVPTKFADAAWDTRYVQVRAALLMHAGVSEARKQRWLRDVDVPGLGALLKPGAEQPVIDRVLAEVRRRTPVDSTYTLERAATPAVPEVLLSNHPVAESALRGLCVLTPREPEFEVKETAERRMLRKRWQAQVEWIARAQVHLWDQVTRRRLLEPRAVDAEGKERQMTKQEREEFRHLLDMRFPWLESVSGVLDLLGDDDLDRVVSELVDEARLDHAEAGWWEDEHRRALEEGREWVVTDEVFDGYLGVRDEPQRMRRQLRERRQLAGGEPWTAAEEDERYAEHLVDVREWLERQVEKGPLPAAERERWSVVNALGKVLPVLEGRARAAVRPSEHLYDQRTAVWPSDGPWVASKETRSRLADQVRAAVHELVLPHPPAEDSYWVGDWAGLAQAALRSQDDVSAVPEPVRVVVLDAASGWLRRYRSRGGLYRSDHATSVALDSIVKALAAPVPVVVKKTPEMVARETLAALEAVLVRVQREELTRAEVDAALDEALDAAVVGTTHGGAFGGVLGVDDVLAVVANTSGADGGVAEGEVDDVVAAAVVRLAGRLEAVLRAAPGQVSVAARSQAARVVLRSSVLPVEAVLALPAFAVFGAEAVSAGAPGSRVWHGEPDGGVPGEWWRRLVVGLVEPTGEDPGAWDRLAAQDVENRGRDAWRSVRAVLADARITTP